MCNHHHSHQRQPRACEATESSPPHAYEGATVRLSANSTRPQPEGTQRHHPTFPWFALWLIWPLMGMLKWALPLAMHSLATLQVLVVAASPLLACTLIGMGFWLVYRGRNG